MIGAESLFRYSVTYGLGIVLSILIALFLFWILRYVLRENSRREDRLAGLIEGNMKHVLDQATIVLTQLSSHDAWEHAVQEGWNTADDRQRREHEEQLDLLRKVAK